MLVVESICCRPSQKLAMAENGHEDWRAHHESNIERLFTRERGTRAPPGLPQWARVEEA
jgi:hypothetical protein